MEKCPRFERISNQFLLKFDSLCRSMESFFFSMFRCICRVFKVQHACCFVENYLVHLHTKCFKNFFLSQQIQIDDGLLEG